MLFERAFWLFSWSESPPDTEERLVELFVLLAASGSAPPDELLLLLDLMVAVEGDDERVELVDDLKRKETIHSWVDKDCK